MKVYLGILAILAAMLLPQVSVAQSLQTFSGCLISRNGLLLLRESKGHTYALHGGIEKLNKYLDDSLQVRGTPEKPQNPKTIGAAIRVHSWKVLGECHLNLSSLSRQDQQWKNSHEPAVPIAGKTGPEGTAVPQTSNESVGATTPPYSVKRNRIQPSPAQPGQPPVAEDEAQPTTAPLVCRRIRAAERGPRNNRPPNPLPWST
jgi:hypothetical protein